MSIGYLILAVGLLIGALFFYVLAGILRDRNERRAADFELGPAWPARTFRVALPYQAGGSYRAAPRRTGPLYPLDLPLAEEVMPSVAPQACDAAGLRVTLPGPAIAEPHGVITSRLRAGESPVAAPRVKAGRAAALPGTRDRDAVEPGRPEAVPSGSPPPATTSVADPDSPPQIPSGPGTTTYQQLLAMATAVNDLWLDRLFAGAA